MEKIVQKILKESNTNFDSLIKNLENNPDLYNFVYDLLILGNSKNFNLDHPIISLGSLYGFFREEKGKVKIHNRIYEQRIYNYLSSKGEFFSQLDYESYRGRMIRKDGTLDMNQLLLKFQEFMKKEHSRQDLSFMERHGRLLFLSFLKPIINGQGFDFKEVSGAGLPGSEEKRLDVVVTYLEQKYVIELKIWKGKKAHEEGIQQLAGYMEHLSLNQGYLIIFDFRKTKKQWKQENINRKEKNIFTVWV